MRKPRLSKKTIEELFYIGMARSGKYEYSTGVRWNEEMHTYENVLNRWDDNNNYEEWEIPANEGIWAFEKR